jgi:hypothetical protein
MATFLGAFGAAAAPLLAMQPCDSGQWARNFPSGRLQDHARAVTTFGEPPSIYLGGEMLFLAGDGEVGQYLGRWNGQIWERLTAFDPNQPVNCFLEYDDGSGPVLLIGGEFSAFEDEIIRRIARWDGQTISPLGTGVRGDASLATIRSMVVFDAGMGPSLYAGGFFTKTGDGVTPLASIARWDGQNWHDVGGGLKLHKAPGLRHDGVRSMAVFNDIDGPALFVAGLFLEAGGMPLRSLAKWDGEQWSEVGEPLSPPSAYPNEKVGVRALSVYDDGTGPALWAAGFFGVPSIGRDYVARYRNGQWEPAGELFGHNDAFDAYPILADFTIHPHNGAPALHIAGGFETAPPDPDDLTGGCVARWDPAQGRWIDLDANAYVDALHSQNDATGTRLWAAGSFANAGGNPNTCLASLNENGWQRLGKEMPSTTTAVTAFDDGRGPAIYVTGGFDTIGDLGWSHGIARYNEQGWSTVGRWSDIEGVDDSDGNVDVPAVIDLGDGPALYSFARLYKDNQFVFSGVVRWDGVAWAKVGQHLGKPSGTLFGYDDGSGPRLFAMPTSEATIFRLEDGQWVAWAKTDGGYDSPRSAVTFDDGTGPALWLGGSFDEVEGIACLNIARYRPGSGWEPVGSGADDDVLRLAIWDRGSGPELYMGGGFTTANGVTVNRVARWDGQTWRPLGKGLSGGINGQGKVSVQAWDDGSGSALYAFGIFSEAGGQPCKYVAKWDGQAWSCLPNGPDWLVHSIAGITFEDGPRLFVSGQFNFADNYPTPGLAEWVPCAADCPADLDGNGSVDLFDFLTFVNYFNTHDPKADCDGSGAFDLFDFFCFVNAFNAGC